MTLYSVKTSAERLNNYSDTNRTFTDTLRYWDLGMSKGVEYMKKFIDERKVSTLLDSSLLECKREYAKLINAPIETKHNWAITTLITVTTLIINWAVFLLINKK